MANEETRLIDGGVAEEEEEEEDISLNPNIYRIGSTDTWGFNKC